MLEVVPPPCSPEALVGVLPPERYGAFVSVLAPQLAGALEGRAVVNINSTAAGGGVAEMLSSLVPMGRGLGADVRWLVIEGEPTFFALTKRLHNMLHGNAGDGQGISAEERRAYDEVSSRNDQEVRAVIDGRDIVVLHDPQTAGLAAHCAARGNLVVWRCHVGSDVPNAQSEAAWAFLRPYLEDHVDAYVFTREAFAPPWARGERLHVIPPSIDPLSPKNTDLDSDRAVAILQHVGLLGGQAGASLGFTRRDGTLSHVRRFADLICTGPAPPPDEPLVVQVSRWDRLKDPLGVMEGFVQQVLDGNEAHLVLAGPSVTSVADDPEAGDVLHDCWVAWRGLPHAARRRVRLACLPMADGDENAVIVNALQRHATVVAQKSIAEGFGLTVAEAMYKSRPVVASALGGIVDQIDDGVTGRLLGDATDVAGFGSLVRDLLERPAEATAMGQRARASVCRSFLPDTHLVRWGEVFGSLLA